VLGERRTCPKVVLPEGRGEAIDAALRRELAVQEEPDIRPTVPVFDGGSGPRPGVDLTSNRAFHEVLDDGLELDARR
jgi:hypothetical protein